MTVQTITANNFEEKVMHAKTPVLLDFWAPWCGPCRMVAPLVDQVAEELNREVFVGKVNVDEQPELASRFNVMSIPTLVVLRAGKEVNRSVGTRSKDQIKEMIAVPAAR